MNDGYNGEEKGWWMSLTLS